MSKMGAVALELQERANEMGFATIDEAIQAGYTPDILTGEWATPEKDEHDHYVELAHNIYDLMNKEFENIKAELTTPQDSDYYRLAFMYEIKEMVEQMDETDRAILDDLAERRAPLVYAYDKWLHYEETPSLWEQLREALRR